MVNRLMAAADEEAVRPRYVNKPADVMSPEERRAHRAYMRLAQERRRARRRGGLPKLERKPRGELVADGPIGTVGHPESPHDIPPEVIADALRRAAAPRSLTAMICGDPAPGQSALDRRAAQGS